MPKTTTGEELKALRDLARKRDGFEVDFIKIAAARALTDRGLARRTGQGWEITAAGERALGDEARDTDDR